MKYIPFILVVVSCSLYAMSSNTNGLSNRERLQKALELLKEGSPVRRRLKNDEANAKKDPDLYDSIALSRKRIK